MYNGWKSQTLLERGRREPRFTLRSPPRHRWLGIIHHEPLLTSGLEYCHLPWLASEDALENGFQKSAYERASHSQSVRQLAAGWPIRACHPGICATVWDWPLYNICA
jgi:hypothetical protein